MSLTTSIHVPDLARLRALAGRADLGRSELPWLDDRARFDRLYFGVEFCQHLLATPDEVREAVAFCRERDLGLTLVTAYGTDAFVERVEALLEAVAEGPSLEILVNDWGVLDLLQTRELPHRPVLGRLLNRMVRDPRLPEVGPDHLGGDAPPTSWRQSSVGTTAFRSLLERLGIGRVESDVPLQGLADLAPGGPRVSVWLPIGMMASGRICMAHALGRPAVGRFVPPRRCEATCRRFEATLSPPWGPAPAATTATPLPLAREPAPAGPRLLLKGNTHLYELDRERIDAALAWAARSEPVDRIVACPYLPL